MCLPGEDAGAKEGVGVDELDELWQQGIGDLNVERLLNEASTGVPAQVLFTEIVTMSIWADPAGYVHMQPISQTVLCWAVLRHKYATQSLRCLLQLCMEPLCIAPDR